jgi:Fur family peroxide stress response transcriptional regulator
MASETQQNQHLVEQFQDAMRRAGVKVTHQRLEIFREVAQAGDHPDAESIYTGVRERMPTVSLDTVYRTLWLLNDLGLITTLGSPHERVRFDANVEPHHHFVCTACGAARDFSSDQFDDLPVPDEVRALGRVTATHVEFRGLCADCAGKQQTK